MRDHFPPARRVKVEAQTPPASKTVFFTFGQPPRSRIVNSLGGSGGKWATFKSGLTGRKP